MKPIADIQFRWFDDSSLLTDDPREALEVFLGSIGVTSDVALDLFEVLLISRHHDLALSTREIKANIVELRKRRRVRELEKGLTDRNIQVWLSYFNRIGLIDSLGGKHRFTGNKKPSRAFREETMPLVEECLKFSERALLKVEEYYKIK
ncbi:MAG: hypothetical protein NTU61_03435 [Candidatus Altiarchaeota archaeon]|nr:hypothetical protein [Candidatus Altiarchaeota archaeon]